MQANSTWIANFISAGTPRGLRRLMLLTNAKYGMFIKYQDFQFVNGKWYAWYFVPMENEKDLADGAAE